MGLLPVELNIQTQAVETTGGWSREFPSDDLTGNLDHGPTPATPSFKVTRVAVAVAKVTATDGGDPARAIDDDETTAWSGKQPITFALARPARLTEVTLKTAGFRARSYPIRITVDGQEVWRGATPRSLGYVTLSLKPVTGQVVKIEPLAGSEAREAFGSITELVDQKNATTGEEKVGSGELGLTEIEFYEPVTP